MYSFLSNYIASWVYFKIEGKGGGETLPSNVLKKKGEEGYFQWAISIWRLVVPLPKIVIDLSRTYRSYTVKVNHIGSAVSVIVRHIHKDR